jgi:hypothetical protein
MAKGFKTVVFVLIFAGLTAGAWAQITISGGFALSSVAGIEVTGGVAPNIDSSVGVGGNVYLDYLLPLSVPLSLGLEVGVDSGRFEVPGTNFKDTIVAIPILLRAAYHFDLSPKLDLYLVGKIGMAFGAWNGDLRDNVKNVGESVDTIAGFAFGFDVGAAYYFTPRIGLFGEVGFDDYLLKTKITDTSFSATLKAPFYRFLTVGLSTKF